GGDLSGVISANVIELARGATEVSMTRTKFLAAIAALAAALIAGTATTVIPVATAQRPADTKPYPADNQNQSPDYKPAQIAPLSPSGASAMGGGMAARPSSQWEYKFVPRPGDSQEAFERLLMDHGAVGWEYCGVETFGKRETATIVFKRPKTGLQRAGVDVGGDSRADYKSKPAAQTPASKYGDAAAATPPRRPPLETFSIRLQHASATHLAGTLEQLFGDRGCRIVAEQRTNTLL